MPKPQLVLSALKNLISSGQLEAAHRVFTNELNSYQTYAHFQELSELFSELPERFLTHPEVAEVWARVLLGARQTKRLEQFLRTTKSSSTLQLYGAWVALQSNQNEPARHTLIELEGKVPEHLMPLYLRLRGDAESRRADPPSDWPTWYTRAQASAKGLELGHCLMQNANAHFDHSQFQLAVSLWADALRELRPDPYYVAWVRFNLGMCLLRDNPQWAVHHYQESLKESRRKLGRAFLPRALCGLAASLRVLGEWPLARYHYQEAAAKAHDPDDRQQAHWGLGHTSRLAYDPTTALGHFKDALDIPVETSNGWLKVDMAASKLMLGDTAGCRRLLAEVQDTWGRSRIIQGIVLAELARLEGDSLNLKAHLNQVDWNTLWVREERHCFPKLFEYLETHHQIKVEPLPYAKGLSVEVRAAGVVQVYINGRRTDINARGRPAELLLGLLESDNEATGEHLATLLYPEKTKSESLGALGKVLQQLRRDLGWAESVMYRNGIYGLDPNAHWQYDMHKPEGLVAGKFAEGLSSNWIEDLRRERYGFLD